MVPPNVVRLSVATSMPRRKCAALRQVYFLRSRFPPAICNPPFLLGSISVGLEASLREHRTLSVSNTAITQFDEFLFPRSQLL